MAQRILAAEARSETGKNAANRLRSRGLIPGIVYGHAQNRMVSIDAREFSQKFKTVSESTLITLKMPTGDIDVLVKDYQENLLENRIVHLDFFEIDRNKALRTRVQIKFAGTPQGVRDGGVFETLLHEIEVECLPKDLPEGITVDVSGLMINTSMHVRDMLRPEGVTFRTPDDQTLCLVAMQKIVEEKPAVEAVEGVEGAAEGAAAEGEAAAESAEGADDKAKAKPEEKAKHKGGEKA
jgi:large subunit ribosomal protein L25